MSDINDGGSVFPNFERVGDASYAHGGISLRDLFAAFAMQAIISNDDMIKRIDRFHVDNPDIKSGNYISKEAYIVADAMIKAREL